MRRRGCVFLIAFVVYNLNLRPIPSGDTTPAALLPLTLLADHTITFDRLAAWYLSSRQMEPVWFTQGGDGHYYSGYPIALPLLLTPLYAPLTAFLDIRHMPVSRLVLLARVLEKVSASLIAALSVAAFLALAERLAPASAALFLTLVYAFGSGTWTISSQALWPHGASELALTLGLLCLIWASDHPERRLPAVLAGLCAGFAVAFRLSNAPFLVLMSGCVLLSGWSAVRKTLFMLSAFWPAAACLAYNMFVFGRLSGGYRSTPSFGGSLQMGLPGLLISPSRGLLVFSPVFIFSAVGVYLWFRGGRTLRPDVYWICLLAATIHILLIARFRGWAGGFAYGPRLLTDIVPFLVILSIPAMSLVDRSRAWRLGFGCTLFLSIAIQGVGAFCYPNGRWEALPAPVSKHRERFWDWRDNQIIRNAAAGPVLTPYRLAYSFLTHPEIAVEDSLEGQGLKLW